MQQIELRVSPEVAAQDALLRAKVAQSLGLEIEQIRSIQIRKHAIDARSKHIIINLRVDVYTIDEDVPMEDTFADLVYPDVSGKPSVVVVGAGPCGLFAALRLIQEGLRPIIVERGVDVMTRRRHLSELHKTGIVNPESNYSYGEGGAGAFSDGKLYTRSRKRGSVEHVLRTFCRFGADPKILIEAHPHIGTDKLPIIIKRMREQIIASGGEVHFSTRMDELIVEGGTVRGIRTNTGKDFVGPVILATGHSARDIYRYLHYNNILVEQKPIAVGVRLEHPQSLIDQLRYHSPKGRGQWLPAAEYVYKTQVRQRGVYSFCMCPGGFVVPASTEPGQTVVNGMSPANRGSKWANSGLVVELRPEDIAITGIRVKHPHSPLALMEWCEAYEARSYEAANQSLKAPAQRMGDFTKGVASVDLPTSSYNMGLTPGNMHEWMPSFVAERLREAFATFDRMTKGFLTNEAQLIGVESRTSSPVRIPRYSEGDLVHQHLQLRGLYPAGEGAGYAGGIVSAAIDGENAALALAGKLSKEVNHI